jgi:hypothetical protein
VSVSVGGEGAEIRPASDRPRRGPDLRAEAEDPVTDDAPDAPSPVVEDHRPVELGWTHDAALREVLARLPRSTREGRSRRKEDKQVP